ncbi:uncharacterized protein [Cicer arietinum]|uniref:uncharacterized protein n=1 Tax=Cicer arietinum TaxID=3827 RepID=UPI003CC6955F
MTSNEQMMLYDRGGGSTSGILEWNVMDGLAPVTMRSGKVSEQVALKAKQSGSISTSTHSEEMATPRRKNLCLEKLKINIPFAKELEQMSTYAKFMKEILSKKRKIGGETVMLTEECSAILQRKLPTKLKDPESFSIPYAIGNRTFWKALCDLGASVSLMPLSIYKKLGIGKVKDTQLMLQFADRSMKHPYGVVEDVLVKVIKFIFPMDFVVLDMEEDNDIPFILGKPFLETVRAMIDVADGTLTLKVNEETVTFNILKAMEHSKETEECNQIEILDAIVNEEIEWEELKGDEDESLEKKKETSQIELKQLPPHLKYVFLGEKDKEPVIISASLIDLQEDTLLRIL